MQGGACPEAPTIVTCSTCLCSLHTRTAQRSRAQLSPSSRCCPRQEHQPRTGYGSKTLAQCLASHCPCRPATSGPGRPLIAIRWFDLQRVLLGCVAPGTVELGRRFQSARQDDGGVHVSFEVCVAWWLCMCALRLIAGCVHIQLCRQAGHAP